MRIPRMLKILLMSAILSCSGGADAALNVVTTLPDYAFFAKEIGGSRVSVSHIVRGDQDAHFVRPKPSFAATVRKADVLVETGLDLEVWLPTVVNTSRNSKVRSGQPGYVAASKGMNLLEKPKKMSRAEGGLHVYGNPHVTCSPILMKTAARNIAYGLIKNDPAGKQTYLANLKKVEITLDQRMFGDKLLGVIDGKTLCSLAEKGKLIGFLKSNKHKGKPLIDLLGGWSKKMLPLRGKPVVTYHKNWIYFCTMFELEQVGTVEPKPGIPPSAKHVADLLQTMHKQDARIILAANYFPAAEVKSIASKAKAKAAIVPIYAGGAPSTSDYYQLVDYWVDSLLKAARTAGVINR